MRRLFKDVTVRDFRDSLIATAIIAAFVLLGSALPKESVGPVLAASVAIIVALTIYPFQKRVDRELQVHQEKRSLYRSLIVIFDEAILLQKSGIDIFSRPEILALDRVKAETEIVATPELVEKTNVAYSSILTKLMSDAEITISSDGRERTLYENALYERAQLIKAMREELRK